MAALQATLNYQYDMQGDPDIPGSQLDFSELHLTYFTYIALPESSSVDYAANQGGEGCYFIHEDWPNKEMRKGFPSYAASLFSSGIEPILESEAPCKGNQGLAANDKFHLVKDGVVYDEVGKVIEDESNEPQFYCTGDGWSLYEDLRFQNAFSLRKSSMLPSSTELIMNEDGSPTEEMDVDQEAITIWKEQLVNGKAISVTFFADTAMAGQKSQAQVYQYRSLGPLYL